MSRSATWGALAAMGMLTGAFLPTTFVGMTPGSWDGTASSVIKAASATGVPVDESQAVHGTPYVIPGTGIVRLPQKVAATWNVHAGMFDDDPNGTVIGIIGGLNDPRNIAYVDFICGSNTVRVTSWAWDAVTGLPIMGIRFKAPPGQDGDAILYARVVPVYGYERLLSLPRTLNTNGTISRPLLYVNGATGNDTGTTNRVSFTGALPSSPFRTIIAATLFAGSNTTLYSGAGYTNKAVKDLGAVIQVEGGQTYNELTSASNYAVSRMVKVTPRPGSGVVTTSKVARWATNEFSAYTSRLNRMNWDNIYFEMSRIGNFGAYRVDSTNQTQFNLGEACVFTSCTFNDLYGLQGPPQSYGSTSSNVDPVFQTLFHSNADPVSPRWAVIGCNASTYIFSGAQYELNNTYHCSWDVVQYGEESQNSAKLNVRAIVDTTWWGRFSYDDDCYVQAMTLTAATGTAYQTTAFDIGAGSTIGSVAQFQNQQCVAFDASVPAGQAAGKFTAIGKNITFNAPTRALPGFGSTSIADTGKSDYIRNAVTGERQRITWVSADRMTATTEQWFNSDVTTMTDYIIDPYLWSITSAPVGNFPRTSGSVVVQGDYTSLVTAGSGTQGDKLRTLNQGHSDLGQYTGRKIQDTNPENYVWYNYYGSGVEVQLFIIQSNFFTRTFAHSAANALSTDATGVNCTLSAYTASTGEAGSIKVGDLIVITSAGAPDLNTIHTVSSVVNALNFGVTPAFSANQSGRTWSHTVAVASTGTNSNGQPTITFTNDAKLLPNHMIYFPAGAKLGSTTQVISGINAEAHRVVSYDPATYTAILSGAFAAAIPAGSYFTVCNTMGNFWMCNSILAKTKDGATVGHLDGGGLYNMTIAQSMTAGAVLLINKPTSDGMEGVTFLDSVFIGNLANGISNVNATNSGAISLSNDTSIAGNDDYLYIANCQTDAASTANGGTAVSPPVLTDISFANGGAVPQILTDADYVPYAGAASHIMRLLGAVTGSIQMPFDRDGKAVTSASRIGPRHN